MMEMRGMGRSFWFQLGSGHHVWIAWSSGLGSSLLADGAYVFETTSYAVPVYGSSGATMASQTWLVWQ